MIHILNARGFEQITGNHFGPTLSAAPVTNDTTIVLALMLLVNWTAGIYDMKDAFLKGESQDCHEIFIEVSQGIEHHCYSNLYIGSSKLQ